MWKRILLVCLLSLSIVSEALAQELKKLAVLEFRGMGLNEQIVLNLSDQTRRAATDLLSNEEYLIMTRETMMEILSDMGRDASCFEGGCQLEVGRNIQADVIVTGDIVQYGATYVLTLKLFHTSSGALLHTVEVQERDLLELKNKTYTESKILFKKGLKLAPTSKASSNSTSTIQSTDSATVSGGDFSLDVVGQANQLAQQIAQLEKVIKDDLDNKEAEIKAKANRQWNSSDFAQLRRTSPSLAVDSVERFLDAYRNVTVEYPQQVAIPISIALTRKVYIPETREAQEWLNDELVPQLDECSHNPSKCVSLGYAYSNGTDGKQQNKKIAARLYQFGCDGGTAFGCSNLGNMYDTGKGVSQDYGRAFELYKQGCDGGNAGGCSNLGNMYRKGKGVSQDYGRAFELYKQGCDGGDAVGCSNLGYMYDTGKGVSQDYDRAFELYKQGCDGGNAVGCSNLGNMYRYGKGVSQNTSLARKYLRQGCDGGNQWGCDRLNEMD